MGQSASQVVSKEEARLWEVLRLEGEVRQEVLRLQAVESSATPEQRRLLAELRACRHLLRVERTGIAYHLGQCWQLVPRIAAAACSLVPAAATCAASRNHPPCRAVSTNLALPGVTGLVRKSPNPPPMPAPAPPPPPSIGGC